jgi:hypothetical protein
MQLPDMVGQGLRTHGPCGAGTLPRGRPPLADPMPPLRDMATHQRHEGVIAAPHRRQRSHAVNPTPGLQPLPPEVRHHRHHLARKRLALDAFPHVEAPQRPPALAAVIPPGPFVQARPAGAHWRAVQAPGHTRLIAAGRLPPPPFRQVLRACVAGLAPAAPAALACLSASAERRPPITGCADMGTSGPFIGSR